MPSVLITGASQGIGAAIAYEFSRHYTAQDKSLHLALVARNTKALAEVAKACESKTTQVEIFGCDLVEEDEVSAMAHAVHSRMGPPDLVVNNAGRFVRGDLLSLELDEYRSVLDVNLTSAFLVTRAFVKTMVARKRGAIFYMGSVAGIRGFEESGAYCVAKHGLLGLARSVRESTRAANVRVTSFLPGATLTPSWKGSGMDPQRMMPPEDIAALVVSVYQLSSRTNVEEIVLRPIGGDL